MAVCLPSYCCWCGLPTFPSRTLPISWLVQVSVVAAANKVAASEIRTFAASDGWETCQHWVVSVRPSSHCWCLCDKTVEFCGILVGGVSWIRVVSWWLKTAAGCPQQLTAVADSSIQFASPNATKLTNPQLHRWCAFGIRRGMILTTGWFWFQLSRVTSEHCHTFRVVDRYHNLCSAVECSQCRTVSVL